MTIDLVPVWTLILALAVFMYVLLDGFDLGVGILFPFAPDDASRNAMMNSVAPIWDGNETWLILGGIGLFAAFPLAFAIIIPASYFPILVMLLGLIFRGVAFEFRMKEHRARFVWDNAFFWGSLLATFAQGVVLGSFVRGYTVQGRHFAGSMFDWVGPFPLAVGVGLVFGYVLLGATWLVTKTEGALQHWARSKARLALYGVVIFIVVVSIWTPLLEPRIAQRWFSWPNIAWLAPVPIACAIIAGWLWHSLYSVREGTPFLAAMALFLTGYAGLSISIWPNIVPHTISLWDAASSTKSQAFLLIGTLFLLPIIVMYTGWSYYVFRGKVKGDAGYH
ncbi:MAG: cytochrome d ubiquinol oxidase subunit II [Betaproteobacteria bacterium]|nr:MAG: cytochrome d ubiquinol oxidase subunit II [Betaproteobacteria bacterium]